jgi:hypothetical protein
MALVLPSAVGVPADLPLQGVKGHLERQIEALCAVFHSDGGTARQADRERAAHSRSSLGPIVIEERGHASNWPKGDSFDCTHHELLDARARSGASCSMPVIRTASKACAMDRSFIR